MFKRNIAILLTVSGSLFAAQGALASQDPAFGYDPFYQFGFARNIEASAPTSTSAASNYIGYDADYVYGSNARVTKQERVLNVMQVRDILGVQAGA